ncbi:MAG: nitroreductase family protein [Chlorobi bacterium]|nr:nitroreductase family protein [Chlorobiota bacterium]
MMLKELVYKNRSYRKFNSSRKVSDEELRYLVDLARVSASSKNKQPLKYKLVTDDDDVEYVFNQLKWAWYLKDWKGPAQDERPTAFIVVFLDEQINDNALIDIGIASQTILLGSVEKGLGGCIIRTVNRYNMRKRFNYPDNLELVQVIAIGEPMQDVKIVDVEENGSIEYFEDEDKVHYVPKRSMKDIILD